MPAQPMSVLNLDALAEMFCFVAASREDAEGGLFILFRRPETAAARQDIRARIFADVAQIILDGTSWQVLGVLGALTVDEPGHPEYGSAIASFWVNGDQQLRAEREVVLVRRDGRQIRLVKSR